MNKVKALTDTTDQFIRRCLIFLILFIEDQNELYIHAAYINGTQTTAFDAAAASTVKKSVITPPHIKYFDGTLIMIPSVLIIEKVDDA